MKQTMNCNNCGKKTLTEQKFCTDCGEHLSKSDPIETSNESMSSVPSQPANTNSSNIIGRIIVFIIVVGVISFFSVDNTAIDKNNSAVDQLEAGDTSTAIQQLQEASQESTEDKSTLEILKNLAYAHDSNGNYTQALKTFKEALAYADSSSSDYYLIKGEIDYYEGRYASAETNYLAAKRLNNADFQIENALAVSI